MEADRSARKDGEKGMVVILMAIAIVGLIGAGSLAIDIGSALVTKSELQNVADAASLASTRELAIIYKGKYATDPDFDYKEYTLTSAEKAQVDAKALAFAAANKAGGLNIVVGTGDVDSVRYNYDTDTVDKVPDNKGVQGFEVTGRRDETQNGEVQTQLARVLGINQIAITAESTAAISALGSLKGGKAEFPIGLDEDWFDSHSCAGNDTIEMYPTAPNSCAGWHTFDEKPASAARLKDIVDGIKDGTFSSPPIKAGETRFEFVGGTITSVMDKLEQLHYAKRQPQNSTGTWTTTMPVYESSGCANPNQDRLIVGFARVRVADVKKNPDGHVKVDVECGIFDEDELGDGGGGGDFGTLVGSPGMIQ